MDEKEQRRADAKLILEGKEVVVQRIVDVFNELFHKDKNATRNLNWLASQLVHAELEKNDNFRYTNLAHDTPLKAYITKIIQQEVAKTMANAMALHAQQMDGQIKQIKKLEKKTWWKR
jgi:hypothetical protein